MCAAAGAKRAEAGEPGDAEVGRLAHVAHSEGSGLARAAALFVKGLDADVLEATAGRLDLAGAAALGFFSLSVLSLLTSSRLSLPKWSDLAWRAYTIFTREERRAMNRTPHPLV